MLSFSDMEQWTLQQLSEVRQKLRESLANEIHKRDAIKVEILYLQKELKKYQEEE